MNNNALLQKIAQLSWPACLLAFLVPYCRVLLNHSGFDQYLFKLYSGQIVLAVALILALVQWIWFLRRKTWLIWPGIVAGIYLLTFAIKLATSIFNAFPPANQNSLAMVMNAETQPMAGLFLLGTGAFILLLTSVWLGFTKRKARAFA